MAHRHPEIAPMDWAKGEVLALGSKALWSLPSRFDRIVAPADAPLYVPLVWRHLGIPANSMQGQHARFDGIESAGYTPRNYAAAGIIAVERAGMDKLQHKYPLAREAVAYRLGTTVMVGFSPEQDILGLDDPDDDWYQVAMRIGKGELDAQVGVLSKAWDGSDRFVTLGVGVEEQGIVPIADVPPNIPLV